jgi:phage FluMu protein Com
MKQIEDLHKKHNKFPEYKNFYLSYSYDQKSSLWEFKGYRCVKCDKVLKRNHNGVPTHQQKCKEINKTREYKTVEIDPTATVLDNRGRVWKPYGN